MFGNTDFTVSQVETDHHLNADYKNTIYTIKHCPCDCIFERLWLLIIARVLIITITVKVTLLWTVCVLKHSFPLLYRRWQTQSSVYPDSHFPKRLGLISLKVIIAVQSQWLYYLTGPWQFVSSATSLCHLLWWKLAAHRHFVACRYICGINC